MSKQPNRRQQVYRAPRFDAVRREAKRIAKRLGLSFSRYVWEAIEHRNRRNRSEND